MTKFREERQAYDLPIGRTEAGKAEAAGVG